MEKRDVHKERATLGEPDMFEKRDMLEKRDATSSSSTFNPNATPYTPEAWGAGSTVTLTTTYESASPSIYTTIFNLGTIIGANATSISGSTGTPTATLSTASATSSSSISNDGRCGPDHDNTVCLGSVYGDCCSVWGWCGSESDTCGHLICDTQHGICDPVPEEPLISQDGVCGYNSFIGATCAGSAFGSCCDWFGECGTGSIHCAPENCDPDYGTCGGSGLPVSIDGECGANSHTCEGYEGGGCCSESGYCGSTSEYCGTALAVQTVILQALLVLIRAWESVVQSMATVETQMHTVGWVVSQLLVHVHSCA